MWVFFKNSINFVARKKEKKKKKVHSVLLWLTESGG